MGEGYKLFGATMSGIVWLGGRKLWLVNGCLEYHQPVITNASPPKRLQNVEFLKYRLRSQNKRLGGVSSQRNYGSASLDEVKLKNLVLWTESIKWITTVKSYRNLSMVLKLIIDFFKTLRFAFEVTVTCIDCEQSLSVLSPSQWNARETKMTTCVTEGVRTLFGSFVFVFDNLHSSFFKGERKRKKKKRKKAKHWWDTLSVS